MTQGRGIPRERYRDPVAVVIMELPIISLSKKNRWVKKWGEVRPYKWIRRFLWWYTKNDRNVILLLRVFVTIIPVTLLPQGYPIEWVVSAVIIGIFVTEKLDRSREQLKDKRIKEEAKEEYKLEKRRRRETDPTLL